MWVWQAGVRKDGDVLEGRSQETPRSAPCGSSGTAPQQQALDTEFLVVLPAGVRTLTRVASIECTFSFC